jgi:glycine/D-amino acid oxidase-like deaminating enzyme
MSIKEINCDVVVVGKGNAALCAALAARDQGATVAVLEAASAEESGGNSRFAGGVMRFSFHDLQELRQVIDITEEEATRWLSAMRALFPDVKEGDRLTGIHLPGMGARFAFNGQPVGDVRDPEFARLFFGIWLAAQSSEPALRDALLGTP